MKRASLFSGLTGLRFSDVKCLKWSEVRGKTGEYHLQFSQEKTEGAEVLPMIAADRISLKTPDFKKETTTSGKFQFVIHWNDEFISDQ